MLERTLCAIFGHRYVVERVIAPHWRKVGCTRCFRSWGMHDPTKAFVPWDGEQAELAERLHGTVGVPSRFPDPADGWTDATVPANGGGTQARCEACNGTGLDSACREETCIVCGGSGEAPAGVKGNCADTERSSHPDKADTQVSNATSAHQTSAAAAAEAAFSAPSKGKP